MASLFTTGTTSVDQEIVMVIRINKQCHRYSANIPVAVATPQF